MSRLSQQRRPQGLQPRRQGRQGRPRQPRVTQLTVLVHLDPKTGEVMFLSRQRGSLPLFDSARAAASSVGVAYRALVPLLAPYCIKRGSRRNFFTQLNLLV